MSNTDHNDHNDLNASPTGADSGHSYEQQMQLLQTAFLASRNNGPSDDDGQNHRGAAVERPPGGWDDDGRSRNRSRFARRDTRSNRDTRSDRDNREGGDRGWITRDRDRNRDNRERGDRNSDDRRRGGRNRGDRNNGDRDNGDRDRLRDRDNGDRNRNQNNRNRDNRNNGDRDNGDRDRNRDNRNRDNRNRGGRNRGDHDNGNRDDGNLNNGDRDNGDRDNGNHDNGNRDNGNRDNGNRDNGNWERNRGDDRRPTRRRRSPDRSRAPPPWRSQQGPLYGRQLGELVMEYEQGDGRPPGRSDWRDPGASRSWPRKPAKYVPPHRRGEAVEAATMEEDQSPICQWRDDGLLAGGRTDLFSPAQLASGSAASGHDANAGDGPGRGKGGGAGGLTWVDLPPEILLAFLTLLCPADVVACAAVCRAWFAVCNDDYLWQHLFDSCFGLGAEEVLFQVTYTPVGSTYSVPLLPFPDDGRRLSRPGWKDLYRFFVIHGPEAVMGDALVAPASSGAVMTPAARLWSYDHLHPVLRSNLWRGCRYAPLPVEQVTLAAAGGDFVALVNRQSEHESSPSFHTDAALSALVPALNTWLCQADEPRNKAGGGTGRSRGAAVVVVTSTMARVNAFADAATALLEGAARSLTVEVVSDVGRAHRFSGVDADVVIVSRPAAVELATLDCDVALYEAEKPGLFASARVVVLDDCSRITTFNTNLFSACLAARRAARKSAPLAIHLWSTRFTTQLGTLAETVLSPGWVFANMVGEPAAMAWADLPRQALFDVSRESDKADLLAVAVADSFARGRPVWVLCRDECGVEAAATHCLAAEVPVCIDDGSNLAGVKLLDEDTGSPMVLVATLNNFREWRDTPQRRGLERRLALTTGGLDTIVWDLPVAVSVFLGATLNRLPGLDSVTTTFVSPADFCAGELVQLLEENNRDVPAWLAAMREPTPEPTADDEDDNRHGRYGGGGNRSRYRRGERDRYGRGGYRDRCDCGGDPDDDQLISAFLQRSDQLIYSRSEGSRGYGASRYRRARGRQTRWGNDDW